MRAGAIKALLSKGFGGLKSAWGPLNSSFSSSFLCYGRWRDTKWGVETCCWLQPGIYVVRHFGACSLTPPEAPSSMLSRQEHPLATRQGSTVGLARGWDFGLWVFIFVAQGVLCPESKGTFLFWVAVTIKAGTLRWAPGLWASAASLALMLRLVQPAARSRPWGIVQMMEHI